MEGLNKPGKLKDRMANEVKEWCHMYTYTVPIQQCRTENWEQQLSKQKWTPMCFVPWIINTSTNKKSRVASLGPTW